jgi:hypothetical protein
VCIYRVGFSDCKYEVNVSVQYMLLLKYNEHFPVLFLLQSTNTLLYITTRQISILTSTTDCICNHNYTLLAQDVITSNRFYCITKQRPNNILIYFILRILWNFIFNNLNFNNWCNLAIHKCKTPWWWHRDVKTCRSIYYINRSCCYVSLCICWF